MVSTGRAGKVEEYPQLQCWERIQCGRQGNCTAYPDYGRACFAVTGTVCRGEDQGSYRGKIKRCRTCSFYQELMGEPE
jgi:methyl-accepting chemotaxis protein